MIELVNKNNIELQPHFSKIWISTLHNISSDSKEIYCSIARQGKADQDEVIKTEYFLSKFVVENGKYECLTKLDATIL